MSEIFSNVEGTELNDCAHLENTLEKCGKYFSSLVLLAKSLCTVILSIQSPNKQAFGACFV